jgi:hypothetical protein
MTVETAVLATNRCLLHFAKDERAYVASTRFLSPGAGLSPFSGDRGWGSANGREKALSSSSRLLSHVHRIIAVGEYVWAHVNFLNLFNDDTQDTGIAGSISTKWTPTERL